MIADSRGYISTWNVMDLLSRFLTPEANPTPPSPGVYWRGHLAPIIKLRYVASTMTVSFYVYFDKGIFVSMTDHLFTMGWKRLIIGCRLFL